MYYVVNGWQCAGENLVIFYKGALMMWDDLNLMMRNIGKNMSEKFPGCPWKKIIK